MGLKEFFFGDRSWSYDDLEATSASEYDPMNPSPDDSSLLQKVSAEVEMRTGVSLHRQSHTEHHGVLGFLGHVDRETQEMNEVGEQWKEGEASDEDLGEAVVTYHTAENRKSGWRYLLGL